MHGPAGGGDPHRRPRAQDRGVPRLRGLAVLDLEVHGARLPCLHEQLLDRPPVGRIVDVTSDVDVAGTKSPREARRVRRWIGVAEPEVRLTRSGALAVEGLELLA